MYCRNCGRELEADEKYCRECGIKVSNFSFLVDRKKRMRILFFSAIGVLAIVSVCIFTIIFSNWSKPEVNSSDDIQLPSTTEKDSPYVQVIQQYYGNYQIATVNNTISLKYKYVDGKKYYSCSEYTNTVLDYFVNDYNKDNIDDITIISLDTNESGYIRDDGYGTVYVYIRTYMSTDHDTYELYDQLSDELMYWVNEDQ